MKLKQLYEIKWVDSANHAIDWTENIGVNIAKIKSVGYLIAKNKKGITLVQNACYKGPGSPNGFNAVSIPKGCIVSVKKLKGKL